MNKMTTFAAAGLVNANKPLTMSTRQIAQLCEKRHDNVIRDFRKLCDQLELDVLKFEEMSIDSYGRPQTVYMLDEDLTMTLVMGYNAKFRFKVAQEWRLMKEERAAQKTAFAALPDFTDPIAAATAWIEKAKEAKQLAEESESKTKRCYTFATYFGTNGRSEYLHNALVRAGYLNKFYNGKTKGGNPRCRGHVPTELGSHYCVADTRGKTDPYKEARFSIEIFDVLVDIGAITRTEAEKIKANPPKPHDHGVAEKAVMIESKMDRVEIDWNSFEFEDDIDLDKFAA